MKYNVDTMTSLLAVIVAADKKIVLEEISFTENLPKLLALDEKDETFFKNSLQAKLPLALAARGNDTELPLSYFALIETLIQNIKQQHSLKEYKNYIEIIKQAAEADKIVTSDEASVIALVADKCF